MNTDNTTELERTLSIVVDPTPDERGNALAYACLTHQRRVALHLNVN